MDVHKTLRELHAERKRIDAVIASLERRLQAASKPSAPKRRGRKSMSPEERRKVSQRMSRYWQARRAQARALKTAATPAADAAARQVSS